MYVTALGHAYQVLLSKLINMDNCDLCTSSQTCRATPLEERAFFSFNFWSFEMTDVDHR